MLDEGEEVERASDLLCSWSTRGPECRSRPIEEYRVQRNGHEPNSEADNRLFLSASEVGLRFGLGKSRVYALAAEGLLPSVRLGRRIWFPRRGLDALAEQAIEHARDRVAVAALASKPTAS
jgi:excisionase family DNA binding protein